MSLINIVVLVSGSGSNLAAIIEAINSGQLNAKITGVISDNVNAYALERARANHLATFFVKNDPELLLKILDECKADLIVLAGYLSILGSQIVKAYDKKIINIHPSLIPKYCGKGYYGLKVHESVIANGEKISGATVHYVDSGIDTGMIIAQKEVVVLAGDTAEILQKRVLEAEHELLVEVLNNIIKGEI